MTWFVVQYHPPFPFQSLKEGPARAAIASWANCPRATMRLATACEER